MAKYLKLEVTRLSGTELYIKVPDDFNAGDAIGIKFSKKVGQIAKETTTKFDWDDYGWEETVEVQSVKEVPESEAMQFKVGEIKP